MTTIILADDHQLVREGLRSLLEEQQEFKVIGQASNGLQAIQLTKDLRPDVLVVDMILGDITGIDVIKHIKQIMPACTIIVLSMYGTEGYVQSSFEAGALGYVLKKSTADELVQAIRTVTAGKRYLSSEISQKAIDSYIGKSRSSKVDPYYTLTAREREVLLLVAQGKTAIEIGKQLSISPRTTEFHRKNIMHKLNVHNHTELVRYCIHYGILPEEA